MIRKKKRITYESQRDLSTLLFGMVALVYTVKKFSIGMSNLDANVITRFAIAFAPTILPLICLNINVYALKWKIEPIRVGWRPMTIVFIVGALICLVASLIPLKAEYSALSKEIKDYEAVILQTQAYDPVESKSKKIARRYYRDTKKLKLFHDLNGTSVLYSPDGSDRIFIMLRENHEIQKIRLNEIKKISFVLLTVTGISFILNLYVVAMPKRMET